MITKSQFKALVFEKLGKLPDGTYLIKKTVVRKGNVISTLFCHLQRIFWAQKIHFLTKYTNDLTRKKYFENCHDIFKIIENLFKKENNVLIGAVKKKKEKIV